MVHVCVSLASKFHKEKKNPKFECRCFPMNFVVNNVVENWNVKLIEDKDKSLEDG